MSEAMRQQFRGTLSSSSPASPKPKPKPAKSKRGGLFRNLLMLILFLAVVGLSGGLYFSYTSYQQAKQQIAELSAIQQEQAASEQQIEEILGQLQDVMIIPEFEEPITATISDAAGLAAEQPFYEGAQDGDVILVWPEAQKAVVYSPERDLIVNVGPAFLEPVDETGQPQPQAEDQAEVGVSAEQAIEDQAAANDDAVPAGDPAESEE